MKKILVVNTVEFFMNGISSVIVNYYKMLDKKEYQIDFVVNEYIEPDIEQIFREGGSKIYIIKRNKNPFGYMMSLLKIMGGNSYDVVHVHGNSATMAVDLLPAKLSGCKIRIAHCHNTECRHKIVHCVLNPIFQKLYTCALSCSLAAGSWIFKPGEYHVLPNGIYVDEYKFSATIRQEMRNQLGLKDKFVLGHIGFINDAKNHPRLFEILRDIKQQNSNVHLLCITGSDYVPQYLEQLIDEYEIRENITILHQRRDVNHLLQVMDVFVFPSKHEGLAVVLLEAQAAGLPCVVSDNITKEADCGGKIHFVSLESDNSSWIECITYEYTGGRDRTQGYNNIKETLFNIKNSSCELQKYYIS